MVGGCLLINPWLALGVATHIFLDMLTPSGVALLYPMEKRYRLARFRTGGLMENLIGGLLALFLFNKFIA